MGQLRDRRRRAIGAAPVLVALLLPLDGCGGRGAVQRALPARVRVVSGREPRVRACLRLVRRSDVTPRVAVESTGRLGRSVTMRVGAVVIGCDAGAGAASRWCAGVVGVVRAGRLVDPRLSLTCRDRRRRPVAFAWIEPAATATVVVVGEGAAAERYAVGGRLPLRVATRDVAVDSAMFRVVQYDARGRELARTRTVAHAAG